jgi:hypothetical protein
MPMTPIASGTAGCGARRPAVRPVGGWCGRDTPHGVSGVAATRLAVGVILVVVYIERQPPLATYRVMTNRPVRAPSADFPAYMNLCPLVGSSS